MCIQQSVIGVTYGIAVVGSGVLGDHFDLRPVLLFSAVTFGIFITIAVIPLRSWWSVVGAGDPPHSASNASQPPKSNKRKGLTDSKIHSLAILGKRVVPLTTEHLPCTRRMPKPLKTGAKRDVYFRLS
jgi:hypothetical protein